jgi:RNA polymerase sigma-70 factor (ECF subfamily)
MTVTDEQLVKEVNQGNKNAFEMIVKRHYQKILNFMFHFLGDKELAKDLSQECFLKLFQNMGSFRGESKLNTFTYSIAKNLCFQHHRKARFQPNLGKSCEFDCDLNEVKDHEKEALPVATPNPLDAMINKETVDLIFGAISSLPLEQRLVFLLSEQQDLSYADIAKILKCPIGTVASRKYQAVKSLKEKLKNVLKN